MNEFICNLPAGGPFGWGRCADALRRELSPLGVLTSYPRSTSGGGIREEGKVCLSAISDHRFMYTTSEIGIKNVGYGFIEKNVGLEEYAPYANRLWDHIICGSTWMQNQIAPVLRIPTSVAVQGVDTDRFNENVAPAGGVRDSEAFIIGSFGKFELRKAQDIVIRAVYEFQDTEIAPQTKLLYNWKNPWPQTMRDFAWSHQKYGVIPYSLDDQWYQGESFFADVVARNGIESWIDAQSWHMPEAYASCDVIVFPNRCEAGTNLCLMEALACGIPCIVSDATGHRDITQHPLYPFKDLLLYNGGPIWDENYFRGGELVGLWHDTNPRTVLAALKYAYENREELRERRAGAAAAFRECGWTWANTAKQIYSSMASVK